MSLIKTNFIEKLRFNENGLIPAIAQDWLDNSVLMLAWMNRESLAKTVLSGEVHYWSRSRNEIWHKGETSGHNQILKNIRFDCDADAILLTVKQIGSTACHTGARSCFFNQIKDVFKKDTYEDDSQSDVLSELYKTIEQRKLDPKEKSYTNKLLIGGDNMILKKIGEESAEFVMACKDKDKKSIANEAADLIFHMQVALTNHEVKWREILEVLEERKGAPRRN